MKKMVLILVIISLVGCFKQEEKVVLTKNEDKIILIEKIIQNEDKEAETKYNEIVKKLKEQAENGNQVAHKEYEEWLEKYSAKKNFGQIPEMPTLGKKKLN